MNLKVVILYSSGLDSLVNLFILKKMWGLDPILLFIDYGQKSLYLEYEMSKKVSEKYSIPLVYKKLNLEVNSKLINGETDIELDVQDDREAPTNLVPYRNISFAHQGILLARKLGASFVSFGFNISEAGAYPDNTLRFLDSLNQLYMSSTYYPYEPMIKFISGSIHFTKTELVMIGKHLDVDFSLSNSCYYPVEDKHCGLCPSCKYRIEAFTRAGVVDKVKYNIPVEFEVKDIDIVRLSRIEKIIEAEKKRELDFINMFLEKEV